MSEILKFISDFVGCSGARLERTTRPKLRQHPLPRTARGAVEQVVPRRADVRPIVRAVRRQAPRQVARTTIRAVMRTPRREIDRQTEPEVARLRVVG